MQRRDALKHTALAMGLTISASTITASLSGCGSEGPTWKPVYLTQDQADLVSEISETLLPATDTPGAKDAGVPQFIDTWVGKFMEEKEKQAFLADLAKFDEDCNAAKGSNFVSLSPEDKNAYLTTIAEAAVSQDSPYNFFLQIKGMTFKGYFTSELVGKEVLNFLAIPGEYNPCMPLSEVPNGRAWTI